MKKRAAFAGMLAGVALLAGSAGCGNPAQVAKSDTVPVTEDSYYTDIYPDTWVATDALGRTMPDYNEAGAPKNDKRRVVGIFYITWHSDGLANLKAPYRAEIAQVLDKAPEARLDEDYLAWTSGSSHWDEGESGYFMSSDV